MNIELQSHIKNEINHLESIRRKQLLELEELSSLRSKVLIASKRGDYHFYYERGEDKNRKYVGSENNEFVKRVKTARYLDASLKTIESNLAVLENTLERYQPYSEEHISRKLPKAYRFKEYKGSPENNKLPYDAIKWLKTVNEKKQEICSKYPDPHSDGLRVQRANGEWMRSKSEVMIADLLDFHGIPYIYELPHYCNGKWIRTDFTILSRKDFRSEILLEHLGLINMSNYRSSIGEKIADYMSAGYNPNINLFFTFDNLDQSYSLLPLQNIINNWLV